MRKFLACVLSVLFAGALFGVGLFNDSSVKAEEKQAKDFFDATLNAEVITDYQAPAHIGNYKGIFVKAKDNGDSGVTLSHEIDLRAFSAQDTLLSLIPITTEPKEKKDDLEVSKITIRLTDVEDEKVYVEMSVQRNADEAYPYAGYASAYGNGQVSTGRYFQTDESGRITGIKYHSANNYGRQVYANFYGRPRANKNIEQDIKPVTFGFDYETSCAHTDTTVPHADRDTIIANLKDSANMKGAWSGFKSGIVKMTITASSENFSNKDAGFMILNFGGLDFSKQSWTDAEKPFFKIDTFGYDFEEIPNAEVFTPYPVYDALAFDKFDCAYGLSAGEKDLTVTVCKEGSTQPISVRDGYFVPMETGVYEIRYSATDRAGNVAEKTLRITANNVSSISHKWQGELSKTATVGIKTDIPDHEVLGVYGAYKVRVNVYEKATGNEIEIENGGFVALREGIYTVAVTVDDFLGRTAVFDYYVIAKARKTPVLDSAPTIPKMMILNKPIFLPDFEAYDYYSLTDRKTDAEKYYAFKNADGETIKIVKPNETFTPDASFGESVIVEYVAKSNLYAETIGDSVEVTLIDTSGSLDFSKYFKAENITETQGNYLGKTGIAYLFESENASISYGTPLLFKGMEFAFRVPKEKNNYDTINVTLTDGSLSNKKVELSIKDSADPDFSDFYVNGEKVGKIYGTFDGTKNEDFLLKINGRNEIIDERGNLVCTITEYADGVPFTGFNENLCYADFTFENVAGESAIQFVKNGRQYFSKTTKTDRISPLISTYGTYSSEQSVGQIVLPGAVAVDALFGRTDVYVEVYTEEEDLVFRRKVSTQEVSLTIKNSGKYTVKYVAEDNARNTAFTESILSVYRTEPLEVSLLGEVPVTAKKGEVVKLPNFSINSELSAYDAVVFVMLPLGGQLDVTDGLSFTAEHAGIYKVYYYVVYEMNNSYIYSLMEYSIEVN